MIFGININCKQSGSTAADFLDSFSGDMNTNDPSGSVIFSSTANFLDTLVDSGSSRATDTVIKTFKYNVPSGQIIHINYGGLSKPIGGVLPAPFAYRITPQYLLIESSRECTLSWGSDDAVQHKLGLGIEPGRLLWMGYMNRDAFGFAAAMNFILTATTGDVTVTGMMEGQKFSFGEV